MGSCCRLLRANYYFSGNMAKPSHKCSVFYRCSYWRNPGHLEPSFKSRNANIFLRSGGARLSRLDSYQRVHWNGTVVPYSNEPCGWFRTYIYELDSTSSCCDQRAWTRRLVCGRVKSNCTSSSWSDDASNQRRPND